MRAGELRQAMRDFNGEVPEELRVKFRVITDRSLLSPRTKEHHGVIESERYRIVATADARKYWWVETLDRERLFRGSLSECFAYIKKRNNKAENINSLD